MGCAGARALTSIPVSLLASISGKGTYGRQVGGSGVRGQRYSSPLSLLWILAFSVQGPGFFLSCSGLSHVLSMDTLYILAPGPCVWLRVAHKFHSESKSVRGKTHTRVWRGTEQALRVRLVDVVVPCRGRKGLGCGGAGDQLGRCLHVCRGCWGCFLCGMGRGSLFMLFDDRGARKLR